MSCCAPGVEEITEEARLSPDELLYASRPLGNGLRQATLSVPDVRCGACIQTIEKALGQLEGVEHVRVNLSTRRVGVQWQDNGKVPPLGETLEKLGYPAHLFEPQAGDPTLGRLLRAVAVSGFAAANIMLLSVSVWSGAEAATRDLFHWISALIALPALAYGGRIFYVSAWQALRRRSLNMDVPISLATLLAFAMSLYETINHGENAYFDAAVTLLFFLLIGRTLDHVMRERARSAVTGLARLSPRGAIVVGSDGSREFTPVGDLRPGMAMLVFAGERVAADGIVVEGHSDLDCSLVNGESAPQPADAGTSVCAGVLNLTGPLTIRATAEARDSFLAEMTRLMEAAEGGRARYRRLADRAAELYAPAVHLAAALTFVVWYLSTGDLHQSIYIAIAVLIITCPCALGLAVPVVQVVATRRLFENGIMVKDGAALERLAECDTALFDKTGTLTSPHLALQSNEAASGSAMRLATALASHSNHPLSRAIAAAGDKGNPVSLTAITEHPGLGIEAMDGDAVIRLGRPGWALADCGDNATAAPVVLARNGGQLAEFWFSGALRADAAEALETLRAMDIDTEILSGDRSDAVRQLAETLDVGTFAGETLPADKLKRVEELTRAGRKVLMIGDGINDAPALGAAHASIAPATAADIGRSAAGFVFLHDSLMAVPTAVSVARRAGQLVRQNFALAVIYNLIAVPAAALGFVTPLVAAIAMSSSSIVVIVNALRLNTGMSKVRRARVDTKTTQPGLTAVPAE